MPTVNEDANVEVKGGYVENPDFVPNPTDQFGVVDTSGTAGAAHSKIEEISPIFEVARRQNLVAAKRALDPNDPDVHESLVTLPQGQNMIVVDADAARQTVIDAADAATEEPLDLASYRGPAQAAAAEGDEPGSEAPAKDEEPAKTETPKTEASKTQAAPKK